MSLRPAAYHLPVDDRERPLPRSWPESKTVDPWESSIRKSRRRNQCKSLSEFLGRISTEQFLEYQSRISLKSRAPCHDPFSLPFNNHHRSGCAHDGGLLDVSNQSNPCQDDLTLIEVVIVLGALVGTVNQADAQPDSHLNWKDFKCLYSNK